ncbi:heme o synthase [Psychrosphaera sp. B3R10]|uniref:Protoheme IX farnesyltransferase n=1 Tax=Psychrosphaera algicola TaxID=3023714 RepID=A0ABT5FGC8_9GAMM|nr:MULTISPECIES: heme o synthase [unclassified Psychrosphaera]MBU2883390.1 heme o synthase [Psychrosphaera sp. I2R16]MBU2990516.1 heme o synthase [Psychrosphaera sp. B3R10]MDC2889775.1 heme o synthase [Psychrosphaera sp. G1-22]MDO6719010.1 heme o synthase [Psychrosphaera sp. 1_MG-2023]
MIEQRTQSNQLTSLVGLVKDLYEITKPKVVFMLVITAIVGMVLAQPTLPSLSLLFVASLGIGLLSAAAAAMNHIVDQKIDAKMARTYNRPIAKGRLTNQQAIGFSLFLAFSGFVLLYFEVNPLTAWLTLASLFGYAVVYTLILKRLTPQNIVIGGLAGAMPPLLGWCAITGEIHPHALLLVMIIFTWTPPHFWALAIHRKEDYARVNIPMLPVTHGNEFTKNTIMLYTILLTLVCILPYLVGMTGILYLVVSLGLNVVFLRYAWLLKTTENKQLAMETFKFSIWHLLALFVVLLVDHFI